MLCEHPTTPTTLCSTISATVTDSTYWPKLTWSVTPTRSCRQWRCSVPLWWSVLRTTSFGCVTTLVSLCGRSATRAVTVRTSNTWDRPSKSSTPQDRPTMRATATMPTYLLRCMPAMKTSTGLVLHVKDKADKSLIYSVRTRTQWATQWVT